MEISTQHEVLNAMPPAGFAEPRWYAAYTCSRHEKHVAMQLGQKQIGFRF